MPFMAEAIYRGVGMGEKESVHLEEWAKEVRSQKPKVESLIKEMEEVRKIVSFGLEQRMKEGIKVRQPLASLKIKSRSSGLKDKEGLLKLIKDELNVKEIIWAENISQEVELDTEITLALKEEGN